MRRFEINGQRRKSALATVGQLLLMLTLSINFAHSENGKTAQPINISITTVLGDNQEFRAGDEISFLLSLNHDAYVILLYQEATGGLVQIFPVTKENSGRVKAGDFQPFPPRQQGIRLVVGAPFGQEQVWAFASDTSFPAALRAPLPRLKTEQQSRLTSLREFVTEQSGLFGEASLTLKTFPAH